MQPRELLISRLRRERRIQLLRYVIPMGMCSGSHPPPLEFSSHILGTPSNRPLPPSILPPPPTGPPKTTAPRTLPHPMALLCVGSSSARLLSGTAPQHVLYAQTDDTAALARQRPHKDNNVLPRSFINTLSSPSQPRSK